MFGAVLGDIAGSPYEFDRGEKTKKFHLLGPQSRFTDDTVMTMAVAKAFMETGLNADDDEMKAHLISCMQDFGRRYPGRGYGARFIHWIDSPDPQPYNSYGNGAAMRVSSAGWLSDSLEQALHAARLSAEVSHNHPEGIKGAQATATSIYLARTGKSKEEIRDYIETTFGYDLHRSCADIRPGYHHVESCQETVPQAIICFLESTGLVDAIRNAVSLGGDTDTLGAIAGSIAEAYYGFPDGLIQQMSRYLPREFLYILGDFYVSTMNVEEDVCFNCGGIRHEDYLLVYG